MLDAKKSQTITKLVAWDSRTSDTSCRSQKGGGRFPAVSYYRGRNMVNHAKPEIIKQYWRGNSHHLSNMQTDSNTIVR